MSLPLLGAGLGNAGGGYVPPSSGLIADFDSDTSRLFQDTAGNTPVTADGQTVKRRNSRVGSAYLTSSAGAVYKASALNGNPGILFNGATSACAFNATNFAITNGQAFTAFLAQKCTARGLPAGVSGVGVAEIGTSNFFWRNQCSYHTNKISGLGGPNPCDDDQELLTLVSSSTNLTWRQNGSSA